MDPIPRYAESGATVPCWKTLSEFPPASTRSSYQRLPTELPAVIEMGDHQGFVIAIVPVVHAGHHPVAQRVELLAGAESVGCRFLRCTLC
jgi:hypothetical protein